MNKKIDIFYESELLPFHVCILLNYSNKDKEAIYSYIESKITNKKRLLNIIKAIDSSDLDYDRGLTFSEGPAHVVIMKEFDIRNIENILVFSHEIQHVVWAVARFIGMTASEDSEEFYTNIQEGLAIKFLKQINGGKDNIK